MELALFDFDGTLIPGDSIAAYVQYLRRQGVVSLGEYLRASWAAVAYGLGKMSDVESKNRALAPLMKLSESRREECVRAFVRDILLPKVYPQAKACIEEHKKAGRTLLLVTASTENYMRYVFPALGFDDLLCTPINPDGTVGVNCKGEEKVRRVQKWLAAQGQTADFSQSYAYGDSKSDLPMLRLCGHPVQVNPKKALRKLAPNMKVLFWK